jgi:phosphatidylglycerol:prolipoprotein diacylglycerol transferase
MRQTLFYIPTEVGGWPLLGFGLLLAAWAVFSVGLLVYLVRKQGWNADTRGYLPLLAVAGVVIRWGLPAIAEPAGLPVRGYGVMLVLALVAAHALAIYRAKRRGLDPEIVISLGVWLVVCGIAGARLFYIVEYPEQYFHGTPAETLGAIVNLAQGGLVVYGSIFGGGAALAVFAWRHKLPGLALADLAVPSVALGVAIGRLGCFLNGCCFGGVCDLPWAVRFPQGSPPHVRQVQEDMIYLHGLKLMPGARGEPLVAGVEPKSPAATAGMRAGMRIVEIDGQPVMVVDEARYMLERDVGPDGSVSIITNDSAAPKTWRLTVAERSLPVHPAQLYSALDGLLICLFLLAYDPFERRDGELLALLAMIYAVTRFLIEIIRTDEGPVFGTGLSISQNVSLLVFVGGAAFMIWLARKPPHRAWPTLPAK